MPMGRVEAISRSYQESMNDNPIGLVAAGLTGLVIFMVVGYFVSTFLKRRRLEKRKAQRRKQNFSPM